VTPAAEPGPIVKAHFGKGVTIGTADETFTVNIRARMQAQASYHNAHEEGMPDVTQMQIRRARLLFQGNIFGTKLTYYFQLGFSNRDTEADLRSPLRDAYFNYAPHASANLRVGQMKVPYGRQRVVSSSAQGMVDRSIVVGELNLDRDVGVQLHSKDLFGLDEKFGYALGVFGGDGRNRLATNVGYLYVGRLVFTPFGGFDELVEADIGREDKPRLSIAAGAARNQATNRPQSTIGTPYADPTVFFDYTHFGVDFMFKYKGFFATGEWMQRKADDSIKSVENEDGEVTDFYSRDAWGAYVQLGQMLRDKLEISARYGHLDPLVQTDPKLSLTHELGGGLSYYFDQHNLKVQGDYFYFAKNNELKDGDHQVRVQTQLYF
jgi:phosphate-selective porin OprO and OprP